MPNNQPFHKYFTISTLVGVVTKGTGGIIGWIAATFLEYLFNFLAQKGVYFINVVGSEIQTNMEKDQWEIISQNSWDLKDKNDAGTITLTDEQKKQGSDTFRSAFRKFAVYSRVRND